MKHAQWLTEFGFELIPLCEIPSDPHYRKRPRDKSWRTNKYTTADIKDTLSRHHACGVRVPTGYVVIDVDVKPGQKGMESSMKFPQEGLFAGSYVTTGSGGYHIFFKLPEGIEKINDTIKDLPGIDFRCIGFQVVAAGSLNKNGKPYVWDNVTLEFEEVTIPEMPPELWSFLNGLQRVESNHSTRGGVNQAWTSDELRAMLAGLDVKAYREHDEWFKIMCSVHEASGGAGMEAFYEWCISDPDPTKHTSFGELEKRWKSFNSNKEGGITRRFLERS